MSRMFLLLLAAIYAQAHTRTPTASFIFFMDGYFGDLHATAKDTVEFRRSAGWSVHTQIQKGREALDWYYRKYGIDMRHASDDVITGRQRYMFENNVELFAYAVNKDFRYHVLQDSRGVQTKQYGDMRVYDAGWIMIPVTDHVSTGWWKGVVKAGHMVLNGHYSLNTGAEGGFDRHVLIQLETNKPMNNPKLGLDGRTFLVDCLVSHSRFGRGRALGMGKLNFTQTNALGDPAIVAMNALTFYDN